MGALTEQEARGKWCPFVRYLATFRGADGKLDTAGCFNRGGADSGMETARCIGSDCMAWRWAVVRWTELPADGSTAVTRAETLQSGYCGLAGAAS